MEKLEVTKTLKIDFNLNPIEEIKKKIFFPNSSINKIKLREKPAFFYKFNFKTVFNYLEETEEVISEVYVFNSKPIKGDLSSYIVLDAKIPLSEIPDTKNAYFVAKEEVKKRIQKKTNEISLRLRLNLEKEKEKIEKKFKVETKDFHKKLEEITENLMKFAKSGNMEKIAEEKKFIDSLKEQSNFQALEKDKLHEIQLESQKHFLNVENKLENLTAIYYPIFVFTIDVNAQPLKKSFTVELNPISNNVTGISCESCSNKVKEIIICSTGHAVCKNCSLICESCSKVYCKKCLKNNCEICSKKICKNCGVRCFRCSKLVCKNHTRVDKLTGRYYCINCSKRCERCGEMKDPFNFKISKKTNAEICETCYRKEMQGKVLEGVFES